MLEVHRWRQIEWRPTAVVALATSVNGTVVAAARDNGAIELWNVAPGSVGWHCHLTIPGKEDAAISSLVWCKSSSEEFSPLGRLFSAGLDGFITEWDLQTLQPKNIVESYGGSVWQLAAEPLIKPASAHPAKTGNGSLHPRVQNGAADSGDSDEDSDLSDSESENEGEALQGFEQQVAVGCDDGCLRLFAVGDSQDGMLYQRTFPRVTGRILSVAWSSDGSRIYAGGSDGCIRCWDPSSIRELLRITAGIGGIGGVSELCVWSLLALRDGTLVSGDSTGSTQFWEGKHGTLLQAHTKHGADVLALAASPSHQGVFAAGADGQVVFFQHIKESQRAAKPAAGSTDITVGVLAEKWVYMGTNRAHTHDVKALALAFPLIYEEGQTAEKKHKKRVWPKHLPKKPSDHTKWALPGTAMLVSGGTDTKLFTYPANAFLAFHPHDICPAPQSPYVQLASEVGTSGMAVFMAQHSTWIDVWRMDTNRSSVADMEDGLEFENEILGKRKIRNGGNNVSRKNVKSNGASPVDKLSILQTSNGKRETLDTSHNSRELAKAKGVAPTLAAKIKCKTTAHISCSAISSNGQYVAFSDRLSPRLYQLEHDGLGFSSPKKMNCITKKKLPMNLPGLQSMQFTPDSTRLLLGFAQEILVIDVQNGEKLHSFHISTSILLSEAATSLSPMKFICTSADSQWVAATTSSAHIHVFNLETLRHHWSVRVPDGSVATSAIFRPSSSNVLIISTAANQIHVLDVEAKELSEWSKVNGAQLSQHLLEFPGPIIGLSVPPTSTSTSVIAYSSRAMCQIDFSKSLRERAGEINEFGVQNEETPGRSTVVSQPAVNHVYANGNGVGHKLNGHAQVRSNFVVIPFKDPVLFLGHTTQSSLLVAEKPWLEVLKQLVAPVFRHLYGT